jgi:hypothetical protein
MNQKSKPLLMASRALESPPQEGGFVLLRDIATKIAQEGKIKPTMLAMSNKSFNDIHPEKVFSKPGWSKRIKIQFFLGILTKSHKYKIVHMAHIPTAQNVKLIKAAIFIAQKSGTVFIQTVTGLPKVEDTSLKKLIWGDYIVCQSPCTYEKVRSLTRKPVELIVPWPSNSRVSYDWKRRQKTRKKILNSNNERPIIVFPGEFKRMGIGTDFSECIKKFISLHPHARIILACRFDDDGIGAKIASNFPGNVQSVGKTSNIIELMEAADLVIFPTKKMEQKFHPPLIITEALTLRTPVLVSSLIDIDESTSPLLHKAPASSKWTTFAASMNYAITSTKNRKETNSQDFDAMVDKYIGIYDTILEEKYNANV